MDEFFQAFEESLREQTLVSLVLSRPGKEPGLAARVQVRPVSVRGENVCQWVLQKDRRETHENLDAAASVGRVREWLGARYRHAHLFSTVADVSLRIGRRGRIQFKRGPPTRTAPPGGHNRSKDYLIPEGQPCPFLEAIGVMGRDGRVRAKAYAKFRQINRFLEFIEDIYASLPAESELRIVDFGCGKSYLTFAVHHLLAVVHGRRVRITGLDRDPGVIATCRDVARRLGLEGMTFEVGDIDGHAADGGVHLAMWLHACDTATDDAIARAIGWEAHVILAVPCCQHEVAARMQSASLGPIEAHGILKERLAAIATDALRAAMLEARGYKTQVLEFIDLEHTAKNVLIRAVRRARPDVDAARRGRARFEQLKEVLGLSRVHLEDALERVPGESAAAGSD